MRPHVYTMPATVDRVVDGDTMVAHLELLPGEAWHGRHVRVEGINAPELSAAGGAAARDFAAGLAPAGAEVTLVASRRDKYGRVLAKVVLADGTDFAATMLAAGHATVMQ